MQCNLLCSVGGFFILVPLHNIKTNMQRDKDNPYLKREIKRSLKVVHIQEIHNDTLYMYMHIMYNSLHVSYLTNNFTAINNNFEIVNLIS